VLRFSTSVGWPIVADPLSQLRTAPGVAPVIDSADVLMRSGATEGLTPEVVVRVGAMPTSKALRLWLERNQPRHVVLFDPDGRWSDPSAMFTIRLPVSVSALAGLAVSPVHDRSWAETWTGRGQTARAVVDEVLDAGPLRELRATRAVSDVLGANDSLVVGSSMPVRDLDLVMRARVGGPRVFANRGANGIDGTIATAAGVASGGSPTTVLLGDLAFIHDLGGLHAAAQKDLDMTVVVMNNAGGGIFSHLPIAGLGAAAFFDELFGTPQRFEFAGAAALVGADYVLADSVDVFDSALTGSSRLRVIEVPLDHREDLAQMHEVVAAVGEKSR
jgi:2-succinyl-5-enolpyruvyl-6-hydroxy-3-cyclohexene-1-carboxylate synthase